MADFWPYGQHHKERAASMIKDNNSVFALLAIMFISVFSSNVAAVTIVADPYEAEVNHRVSLYLWGAGLSGHAGNAAGRAGIRAAVQGLRAKRGRR